jgi:hypothetical protein
LILLLPLAPPVDALAVRLADVRLWAAAWPPKKKNKKKWVDDAQQVCDEG